MAGAPIAPSERPLAELLAWFRAGPSTLVALSGGVDSAVVAALAQAAIPGRVRAATLTGPAVAGAEVARARALAERIGLPHELVPVDPLAVAAYRTNPPNRCFFCRSTEAAALRAVGEAAGIGRYVDGVHADDLGDDRPGIRALDAAGFEHPLLRAAWTKRRVREYAREIGLPVWDQPSDACLASRVAHGTPIDAGLLGRVEAAEAELLGRGYRRVRVRVAGGDARVEVGPDEVGRLLAPSERTEVVERLRRFGFASVTIDPRGYALRANA